MLIKTLKMDPDKLREEFINYCIENPGSQASYRSKLGMEASTLKNFLENKKPTSNTTLLKINKFLSFTRKNQD